MGFDMNYSGAYQKYFSKEHDLVRKSIREFIRKEVLPNINEWEENGAFPIFFPLIYIGQHLFSYK